jgi:RNA polymerase sigma-70 factor (ECF subfamily)
VCASGAVPTGIRAVSFSSFYYLAFLIWGFAYNAIGLTPSRDTATSKSPYSPYLIELCVRDRYCAKCTLRTGNLVSQSNLIQRGVTQVNTQTTIVPLSSDIIRRAQEGDSDAFADLFNAHKSRIYSLCLRMTNNIAEAEDLTQDAFVQVFRKLSTFRGDSALSTWLHRIAVNTVLMHFRKKVLRQVSLDERADGEGKTVRRECGSKDGRLAGTVDRIALIRALNELPAGYRTIFLLHEVQGYEHQEIARMLECSVGNSKSQLHKAKLRIRQILGQTNAAVEAVPSGKAETQREFVPGAAARNTLSVTGRNDLPVSPGQFAPLQLAGVSA